MIKKLLIVMLLMLISIPLFAEDQNTPPEPERFDFPGGVYFHPLDNDGNKVDEILIIEPNRPMMTDRFASYGNITIDPKTGQRSANTKNKEKVTKEGLEIYDLLDRMKMKDSDFFVFKAVVLRYDSVTLIKYSRIEWGDYMEDILKVFE